MTDQLKTLELFPGVQFREDPSQPVGSRWQFEYEGRWIAAHHAYADDIFLDHIAEVVRQRDLLAQAIADAGVECGHIAPGHSLSGPQLLMILGDMVTMLKAGNEDAERWRAVIGCGRIRALGCAGLTSDVDPYGNPYGNKAHIGLELWTIHPAGSEPMTIEWFTKFADKAVAVMKEAASPAAAEPAPEPPPAKPWREIAEPVPDDQRKCHQPGCWNCEGTGRDPDGGVCTMNDKIPF